MPDAGREAVCEYCGTTYDTRMSDFNGWSGRHSPWECREALRAIKLDLEWPSHRRGLGAWPAAARRKDDESDE